MRNNTILAEIREDSTGGIKNEERLGKNAHNVIEDINLKKDSSMLDEIIRKIKKHIKGGK